MTRLLVFLPVVLLALAVRAAGEEPGRGAPWRRHTIDASSRGADGVRLADTNGDGLPDIVTGWEEGGVVRVYRNPGPRKSGEPWPAVTVGQAPGVEDAVLVDLDGDGALDVVSCAEQGSERISVHWAPREPERYLEPAAWKTEVLPASEHRMLWMFCAPAQVDGRNGVDLIAAGKGRNAAIGWWEAPPNPRDLAAWKWHPLRAAGWVMSLVSEDMDGDGDTDLLCSDRKGKATGCFWLEHPGAERAAGPWPEHPIGAQGREVMFLRAGDVDGDGLRDVVAGVKPRELLLFCRKDRSATAWEPSAIQFPENTGTAKGVAVGDVDGDRRADLVFSCEMADPGKSGVMALLAKGNSWSPREISGSDGVKHDLVELLDLDGDGDPDVLTCEEVRNLGILWYENPLRSPTAGK